MLGPNHARIVSSLERQASAQSRVGYRICSIYIRSNVERNIETDGLSRPYSCRHADVLRHGGRRGGQTKYAGAGDPRAQSCSRKRAVQLHADSAFAWPSERPLQGQEAAGYEAQEDGG